MSIPKFFTLNDRPVRVIDLPDGTVDVMALDMRNGDWVRAMEYLDRFYKQDADVEILSEDQFKARVSEIRKDLDVQEFD